MHPCLYNTVLAQPFSSHRLHHVSTSCTSNAICSHGSTCTIAGSKQALLLRGFSSCPASKSQYHRVYFLPINHLLVLITYAQVEGQTYKIHRYFLTRESEFFKDLFSLPQPGDSTNVEGSDNNPIEVPETPINEIENLFRFFYFGYETCC